MQDYIDTLCNMSDNELRQWIIALEIEADGLEDECTRLHQARAALSNRMTYNTEE